MARIDTDLLGLQIVALDTATVVGEVDGLLIDDATVKVAGFLVDLGLYEASVLPYASAHSVGLDAVIVESGSKIAAISANPALAALAEKDITITDAKAITREGRTVGTIGDYFIDTKTGEVVGMEFIAADQTVYPRETAVIPASSVYRLGRDIIVLEADYDQHLQKDDSSLERVARTQTVEPAKTEAPAVIPVAVAELEPVQPIAVVEPEPEPPVALEPAPVEEPAHEPAQELEEAFEAITTPEEATAVEAPAVAEAVAPVVEPAVEVEEVVEVIEEPPVELVAELKEVEPEVEVAEEIAPLAAVTPAYADDTLTSEPALDLSEPEVAVEEAPVEEPPVVEAPAAGAPTAEAPAEDAFTSQQKHFLIGKRVLRRIETPSGELIADMGELVTFEIIQKAKGSDQLLILSLNVE
ncbi:MAG: PRC-barrel domain-containing protein [Actinobacteria bacterium]|nr:PRC-barrel domain-containing protein [Actinomycetota bacterium]